VLAMELPDLGSARPWTIDAPNACIASDAVTP
jgi:hypothetical protein